jgi:hypothetical protein
VLRLAKSQAPLMKNTAPGFQKNFEKKEQGHSPARKIVSTLFPQILDLSLIYGATLLVRVRAPPETWTTRLVLADRLSFES